MTIIIPDGFAQATITYESVTFDSGKAATVLGFSLGTGTLEELANSINDAWEATLRAEQHLAIDYLGVRVVTETNAFELADRKVSGRNGSLAPPNTTVLVKKVAPGRGREHQGRNYWPGFLNDEDVSDSGTITSTRLSDLTAAFTAFGGAIGADSFAQVILHNNSATAPSFVTSGGVEGKPATQRRRLRR